MAKEKSNFSLKRLIFNDKYLIITSLLLATLVWIVTSLNIGIDETKTIKMTVPIVLGDEVSEQLGTQYYTLHDAVELNVTITGAKYAIGQVTEQDLKVSFDTSNVNRIGEQSIPILVTNKSKKLDFTVSSVYPSSIDAYHDVKESKTFDVFLEYSDDAVADGYTFGSPVLSEDKVVVSGPKTYVDKVERVMVNVDFSEDQNLTETFNSECELSIEGVGVESNYLTMTTRDDLNTPITTVSVTLPVLKIMNLPVEVDIDDIPSGFDKNNIGLRYSMDNIEAGVLDNSNIKSAKIGSISFSDLKFGSNKFTFDVTDLEGITLLDESVKTVDVYVTIPGTYIKKYVSINPSDVKITGVGKETTAELSNLSTRNIAVYVPKELADEVITLDVKCDVSEKNDDNKYPLAFSIKNTDDAWVYGSYTATVTIK